MSATGRLVISNRRSNCLVPIPALSTYRGGQLLLALREVVIQRTGFNTRRSRIWLTEFGA
ncbi:hypothetical protein A8144_11140 [Mycobacterium leprae 3125609]|nr:hypothetical protein A8144_11140 [Mycobacterium leprae 3125609]OAX70644.1 hypothetical protein A3216_10830 [Mycobacterium leprae 7935681]